MKSFRGCPLLVYGLIDSVAIRRQAGGARNSGRVCCSLPSGCLWLVYSCLQDGAQVFHPCSWSMGRSSLAHVHFLATRLQHTWVQGCLTAVHVLEALERLFLPSAFDYIHTTVSVCGTPPVAAISNALDLPDSVMAHSMGKHLYT